MAAKSQGIPVAEIAEKYDPDPLDASSSSSRETKPQTAPKKPAPSNIAAMVRVSFRDIVVLVVPILNHFLMYIFFCLEANLLEQP